VDAGVTSGDEFLDVAGGIADIVCTEELLLVDVLGVLAPLGHCGFGSPSVRAEEVRMRPLSREQSRVVADGVDGLPAAQFPAEVLLCGDPLRAVLVEQDEQRLLVAGMYGGSLADLACLVGRFRVVDVHHPVAHDRVLTVFDPVVIAEFDVLVDPAVDGPRILRRVLVGLVGRLVVEILRDDGHVVVGVPPEVEERRVLDDGLPRGIDVRTPVKQDRVLDVRLVPCRLVAFLRGEGQ